MKEISAAKVIDVINSNIEEISLTSEQLDVNLTELGMDSYAFIRVIVGLEEAFDCEIPDSKLIISEMDTVEKIMTVLQNMYDELNT